jgi:protein TonB
MRRKPSVLLLSILVHAAALLLLATADFWLPIKNWPVPHEVLAFSDSQRLVRIEDIVLPHPPRAAAAGSPSASSVEAAPLAPVVATTGIVPESGLACVSCQSEEIAGVEPAGTGTINGIGTISAPPPPPPPQPVAPIRPHSGVRAPTKTVHVAPVYPALARASRVQGVVIIEATIDIRGNVESARILRSIPLLDQAALDAVHEWKFTPTLLNGIAVPIIMTVTVNFTLAE